MIKRIFLISMSLLASVHAQQLVGGEVALKPEVSASVKKSVQALGNEVLKSNYRFAVDKMYPRWRVRQAKRLGSETLLLESFNKAGAQMQEAGITIDSFVAQPAWKAYRVHPKKKPGVREIRSSEDVSYELLVFVPTKMKMTFYIKDAPKRSFMRESFQIALAQEGTNQWTFIDGATIRVQDLRSMFPLLPHGLELPKKLDTEIKN
ncbi:hypothetical protein [Rubritalea tangerina]|uniref:Outer membrane lipoprotein carrier protein LolA n=1 Tax=Rubritalea tangerina TaxID=430798 RepID=A0ABW4ZAM2_9BACT